MGKGKRVWFGGKGRGLPIGDAASDPIGAVRVSPDGRWLAVQWPSRPSPSTWAVVDHYGSAGYERPERVAHWPVVGVVPFSPAAGRPLKPHKQPKDTPGRRNAQRVLREALEAEAEGTGAPAETPRSFQPDVPALNRIMINTPAKEQYL